MAKCLDPRPGWFSKGVYPKTGRELVVFSSKGRFGLKPDYDRPVEIACNHCVPCVESKGAALSIRVYHDWVSHGEVGTFGTLTYDDAHMPSDGRLNRDDVERFKDRLDRELRRAGGRWRGVVCGEYGKNTFRPHYHFILIGADLCVRSQRVAPEGSGDDRYVSALLNRLWPYGHNMVSPMNGARALYVGKHCIKNFHDRDEVFRIMSRKPGIGYGWLERYWTDLLKGFVVIDGCKLSIPIEYLRREQLREQLEPVRQKRREFVESQPVLPAHVEKQRREAKAVHIMAKHKLFSGKF